MLAQHASEQTDVIVPPSKIDQFPAELLVEIFALCWCSFTPRFVDIGTSISEELKEIFLGAGTILPDVYPENSTPASYETEIARLAHAPLLAVSQVCAKWRTIAMGTSFLWCDIELNDVLWNSPNHSATAVTLLQSTLMRGGNSPLNITVGEDEHLFPETALDMLTAHSGRWQTFSAPGSFIDAFSGIRDKLPRLRSLQLDASDNESGSLAAWGSMPSLKSLVLAGEILAEDARNLPLKQLKYLECVTLYRYEGEFAIYLMSLLPIASECHLRIRLFDNTDDWSDMDSVTSNISTFYLRLSQDFDSGRSLGVLEGVLDALTLPLLTQFALESFEYPRCPLLWPHRAFFALSARSSFDSTLRTLQIFDVHITEAQLMECLSHLPSLEQLSISDHQRVDPKPARAGAGANEVLITDSLLSKLTLVTDSLCLVPRLSYLGCQTLMRFDDRALLALAVSRLNSPECQNGGRFGLELNWLPGHERRIDEAVRARLDALNISTNRRFTFRITAAEDMWA
ncbi:hypothetical protein C8R45DRAFT_464379 [Mycena sanguinolenta]|nr:hypothetical protein C8R45DRAFT_464379 [Mycena sanguinolenta]